MAGGLVAGLALLTAIVALAERWLSSRIGEGLIYDLRTQVFGHVLRQPIAFFTRAQTGALVSRLGQDVIGAQQAFTSVLSNTVSNAISLVLILVAMASLSWQLTLGAVLLVPLFLVPAKLMGRRLADLSHQQMGLNADLSSRMTERFNVAGALLVKLFGRPATEDEEYAARAAGGAVRLTAKQILAVDALVVAWKGQGGVAVGSELAGQRLFAGRLAQPLVTVDASQRFYGELRGVTDQIGRAHV